MPYNFTTQQQAKLGQLYADAQATANSSNPTGAYAVAYQYVADVLAGKVDKPVGTSAPVTLGADVLQVQLWFAGAARANAGDGPFSTLIREYTQTQAELRGIGRFSDTKIQEASNAVGAAAFADMLKPDKQGRLLTITEIATNDATAVGRILFPTIPNADKNPAWSGVALFGMLGSDQTWRVYGVNGQYTDTTQCMDTGNAVKALKTALDKTASAEGVVPWIAGKDQDILIGMWKLQNNIPADQAISPWSYVPVLLDAMSSATSKTTTVLRELATSYVMCQNIDFSNIQAPAIGSSGTPPADASTRNSANYITTLGHSVQVKEGGNLWDAFVLQTMNPTGFTNWADFQAATAVNNPQIVDLSQLSVGQTLYIPEKLPNGSTTYNYANGASVSLINTDVNADGKTDKTTIAFTAADQSTSTAVIDYTPAGVKAGETFSTLSADKKTTSVQSDANGDGIFERTFTTVDSDLNGESDKTTTTLINTDKSISTNVVDYNAAGSKTNETKTTASANGKNVETSTDKNGDGKWDNFNVAADTNDDGVMDRFVASGDTQNSMFNADRQIQNLYRQGQLGSGFWNIYTDWSTTQLLNNNSVNNSGWGELGSGTWGLNIPNNLDLNPIGAFYESKSANTDPALSIASKTFRILNSAGVAVSAAQLNALDLNADGRLTESELNGLSAWSDLSEDGVDRSGTEVGSLASALTNAGLSSLRANDYGFYTAGNANYRLAAQSAESAPANALLEPSFMMYFAMPSNYTVLRATDNRFFITSNQWIDWSAGQIKLSSNQLNMVGTDGNDNFDINYYIQYNGLYFNLNLVQNFYAGAGNDVMGGSSRSDNLWGGTGNDTLLGYEGDDKLYGEEGDDQIEAGTGRDFLDGGVGNDVLFGQDGDDTLLGGAGLDELLGGAGNDQLDGGIGNDKLFGGVGNDVMIGGDGADILLGFNPSNDAKQTLAAGESDDDTIFGGTGADQIFGGLGNDFIDGGADNDLVQGEAGADTLFGGSGDDEVNGGADNDIIVGGIGVDKLFGGVGNDKMWGGDGNDIMMGFTPSNDAKQTLLAGETDNDVMFGGAGDDLMLGGLGDDQMWGGVGIDEIQGGDNNDSIYGEDGNDRLFGGAGNDTIYGGSGDDLIVGGAATNEAALSLGVSDNNFLYGGAGNDTILGGTGNDYIDGGAGADDMEGDLGDDIYVVNSVNDVILEQYGSGYDTVISSANYILNANIEALRLVEGFNINGTGNRLNNQIIGNSQDNILDGVTGADTMIGGLGNDIYYVDNVDDQAIELTGEGTDTVNASISYTLGANLENLTLLDFSKAEKGIADGTNILVYGYPKAFELDYMQGNAVAGYKGTCALTSIANLSTQANQAVSEAEVVQRAIDNQWTVTSNALTDYQRGGSNYVGQQALLESYNIRNGLLIGYNEQAIANLIKGGRGVIIGLNAGKLWGDNAYLDSGGVNHVVTVTGAAVDAATGALNGFYIADSGRGLVSDMTRYVSIEDFRTDANVAKAYSIYTIVPIKLWEENINATGNDMNNIITGNRGDNTLTGGKGNDTLIGQTGNDTYQFARGDGQDTIVESDATAGNTDVLQLTNANQNNLWFKHVGNNLQINLMGTTDQITIKDWYAPSTSGTDNQIERIKTADGLTMYSTDVEQFVQAMAAFAPPSATQTSWTNGQTSNGQILLAVAH